jgi:hypothetical protein
MLVHLVEDSVKAGIMDIPGREWRDGHYLLKSEPSINFEASRSLLKSESIDGLLDSVKVDNPCVFPVIPSFALSAHNSVITAVRYQSEVTLL